MVAPLVCGIRIVKDWKDSKDRKAEKTGRNGAIFKTREEKTNEFSMSLIFPFCKLSPLND